MKVDLQNPRHWSLLALQFLYTCMIILVRPLRKRPVTPIVVLYGHQFAGNLRALYLEWEKHQRSGIDLYFLTLDPDQALSLEQQDVNVLRCNRLRDMMLLTNSPKPKVVGLEAYGLSIVGTRKISELG